MDELYFASPAVGLLISKNLSRRGGTEFIDGQSDTFQRQNGIYFQIIC
jgi:hypothetical protein